MLWGSVKMSYTDRMGVYTDSDLDDLVRENLRLTQENNKLLKKIRRSEVVNFWIRILFFLVLIGVPILVYQYYLEPYVQELFATYQRMQEDAASVRDLSSKLSVPDGLKALLPGGGESATDQVVPQR